MRPTQGSEARTSTAEPSLELVGFRIGDWRFAVRLAQVKTSVMPAQVTRVWLMPPWIKGIISLHGSIVCVLDLGELLGLADVSGRWARFMIITDGLAEAAIPVHEVFRVPEVPARLLAPLPPTVQAAQRELLEGIVNMTSLDPGRSGGGEDTLTLLDAAQLFGAPEVRALRGQGGA